MASFISLHFRRFLYLACTCLLLFSIYSLVMRFAEEKAKTNLVIVRSDGGFCSQIAFHALGHMISQKGYKVKYDLTWFRKNNKDLDGIFARNYDIGRAFPNLKFEEATEEELNLYRRKYVRKTDDINKFIPPMYVNGYPEYCLPLFMYRNFFIDNFNPVDIAKIQDTLKLIENCNSCAIHVRRGDVVKNYLTDFGYPCSVNYFIKAIKIMTSLCAAPKPKFFFFSDEPDWVKQNIIPQLDKNVDYYICEKNGSDAGYLDLYLIAHCKHIIASQGGFGLYGRMLSKNDGYFIGPMNKVKMANYFDNCIFLSDIRDRASENKGNSQN